ncbi:MAG: hypothetical protein ACSHWN_04005 [Methylophilaceae bacterium]
MNWKIILFIVLIAYGGYQHFHHKDPSQFVASQVSTGGIVNIKGYHITALEPFDIQARVLSSKHYSTDKEADLVPVDLALGWGPMADLSISNQVRVTQSNRWYHWRVDTFPIPRREIETNSANMHLIPATPAIAEAIQSVKVGQMIRFTGDLVEVVDPAKGWRWKSSLTRNDTGAGACELVLVKSFSAL